MDKKLLTIFQLLESEEAKNQNTSPSESYTSKAEDFNDETKDSFIFSSFNYFKQSSLSADDYFIDEPELEDKSNHLDKKSKENISNNNNLNNSTL